MVACGSMRISAMHFHAKSPIITAPASIPVNILT